MQDSRTLAYLAIFIISSCLTVKLRAAPLQFVGLTVRVLKRGYAYLFQVVPSLVFIRTASMVV